MSWFKLLTYRQTWSFFFGKFLTDGVWWFYLFWLPSFLNGDNERKWTAFKELYPDFTGQIGDVPGIITWTLAVAVVYSISTFGSIYGGWLPKRFIDRGMPTFKARKMSMFVYALFPLTVLFASRLGEINTWYAILIIGVACAAHQAWSANIFTTVTDMFPKKAVASVTGIGGMAGAVGGLIISQSAGLLLKHFSALGKIEIGYGFLFMFCGVAYVVAWIVMHLFVPKMKRVEDL